MSAASASVKYSPGTLCAMARRNSPRALGIDRSAAMQPAPADSPKTVTRSGSPPNAAMLSCTHRSAATWSSSPRVSGAPAMRAKPSAPTR
jgi:hypothetical protein